MARSVAEPGSPALPFDEVAAGKAGVCASPTGSGWVPRRVVLGMPAG
jgi:hypothetical protein